MLALKVTVGADDAHAEALAAPWHLAMVRQRAGIGAPIVSVDEALAHTWTDEEKRAEDKVDVRADAVGGPQRVRARITEMARAAEADEVFAITNTFDLGGSPRLLRPARRRHGPGSGPGGVSPARTNASASVRGGVRPSPHPSRAR